MEIVYPPLNDAAETASASAQANLLTLNRRQLYLLTGTAFVAGWNPTDATSQRVVAICICLLMLAALYFANELRQKSYDVKWFDCRAASETIKSVAWFYVMSSKDDAIARAAYVEEAAEIFEKFPGIETQLFQQGMDAAATSTAITMSMEQVRRTPVAERAETYRRDRAIDQRDWYARKSKWNGEQEDRWRSAILICEVVAIAYAIGQAFLLWQLNVVGGIAAMSAAAVAWLQTKRFGDLHKTYAVAAKDLQQIMDRYPAITSDGELTKFVTAVESAVSREHSIWLKRRMA